jgi:hypothetical protein
MWPDGESTRGWRRRRVSAAPLGALLAAVVAVTVAAGCSGAGGDADVSAPTSATSLTSPSSTQSEPASAPTSEAAASSSTAATTTSGPAVAGAETIATVPEVGVPGLDSADPFCRAWSEFAGSFQALAFASATASDALSAARLEVIASGAVTSAVRTLAEEFPDPIAAERDVFLDDVIGPFARRAIRAADELDSAGLSSEQIRGLGDAWLAALATTGADDSDLVISVPDDVTVAVDAATATFAAGVPPIVSDPSLVTAAEAPATFDHLAENCPDQGILAGNDAVG